MTTMSGRVNIKHLNIQKPSLHSSVIEPTISMLLCIPELVSNLSDGPGEVWQFSHKLGRTNATPEINIDTVKEQT